MIEAPTPTQTLDAKGLLCPLPIINLARAIKKLSSQEILLLEATDPGAIPDVAAWSRTTGNLVLYQDRIGKVMRFWIQKS
ncbi:MAG: sulfurtransferase TusA family protein [Chloroflexota bacterium]|jgi:tRNA 2-thiouridine synthesizing protein A